MDSNNSINAPVSNGAKKTERETLVVRLRPEFYQAFNRAAMDLGIKEGHNTKDIRRITLERLLADLDPLTLVPLLDDERPS